jgi:hypothetical protein
MGDAVRGTGFIIIIIEKINCIAEVAKEVSACPPGKG